MKWIMRYLSGTRALGLIYGDVMEPASKRGVPSSQDEPLPLLGPLPGPLPLEMEGMLTQIMQETKTQGEAQQA